jgi:hypothetical protein
MSTEELAQVLAEINRRRAVFNDTVFVLVLERSGDDLRLLDYGFRDIGDLAAWIAVQKTKPNSTQGERV